MTARFYMDVLTHGIVNFTERASSREYFLLLAFSFRGLLLEVLVSVLPLTLNDQLLREKKP